MIKCTHFNGHSQPCAVGKDKDKLSGRPEGGWSRRLPCVKKNSIACDKAEFIATKEELEKEAHTIAQLANMFTAIRLIAEKTKAEPSFEPGKAKEAEDQKGTIECPSCKGTLHYFVSGTNGHIHGNCSTKGCLAWMM